MNVLDTLGDGAYTIVYGNRPELIGVAANIDVRQLGALRTEIGWCSTTVKGKALPPDLGDCFRMRIRHLRESLGLPSDAVIG